MKLILAALAVAALAIPALASAAPADTAALPKPYQWTTAQANAALMAQSEDFYIEELEIGKPVDRDLLSVRCRGTGNAVQRRFVASTCAASYEQRGDDMPHAVVVNARTRKAGGLCWSVAPEAIPSGCLAPGIRDGKGSVQDAFLRISIHERLIGKGRVQFRGATHGAGFFTVWWENASGAHTGTVTFGGPQPVVRVLRKP